MRQGGGRREDIDDGGSETVGYNWRMHFMMRYRGTVQQMEDSLRQYMELRQEKPA